MTDALLWNEIGNLYMQFGSHPEAIAAIKRAIEMNPDSAWFHCNLGQAYARAGEHGDALLQFRKSLQLMDSPQDQAVVWNKIGDTCRALKDLESAMRAYKKADDLNLAASRSESRTEAQSTSPANFLQSIRDKIDPDTSNLLSGLKRLVTQVERSFGNQPEAEVTETEPADFGWQDASTLADTRPSRSIKANKVPQAGIPAQLAVRQENISNSTAQAETPTPPVKKTIIVIPDPNGPSQALGEGVSSTQTSKENKDPAPVHPNIPNLEEILAKIHIYENITRSNPANDRGWDTLGKLYKSLGRFQDAITAYKQAIQIAPQREVYYYYLGLLYSVEQQHEAAVEAFEAVLHKNPEYVLAHGALAGVYHRMGLENKANHHITIALPMMNNESAYNRACFHAICGDSELALDFLQQALKNNDTTIEWIKSDPDLDPVRTDPRYLDLVSGVELPDPENNTGNYFSCDLDGAENRLLPILNDSLAR